jgi:hypothetical protein
LQGRAYRHGCDWSDSEESQDNNDIQDLEERNPKKRLRVQELQVQKSEFTCKHKDKLASLEKAHTEALAKLKEAHAEALAKLEESYRSQKAELKMGHKDTVRVLGKQLEETLKHWNAAHRQAQADIGCILCARSEDLESCCECHRHICGECLAKKQGIGTACWTREMVMPLPVAPANAKSEWWHRNGIARWCQASAEPNPYFVPKNVGYIKLAGREALAERVWEV